MAVFKELKDKKAKLEADIMYLINKFESEIDGRQSVQSRIEILRTHTDDTELGVVTSVKINMDI